MYVESRFDRVVNRLRIGNGEECTHLKFYLSKREEQDTRQLFKNSFEIQLL
jgi:hypothetical protein